MAKEAETKREKMQDRFYFSHKSLYVFPAVQQQGTPWEQFIHLLNFNIP